MNIHQILEKIGLSKNEIDTYLTGLKAGPSTAGLLAKKTKLNRPLTYYILEKLKQKGLVSEFGKKHGKRFVMESPTRLKTIVEWKKKELTKLENQLENVASEIESHFSQKTKPSKVKFYEGEGLKNVALDILNTKEKIYRGIYNIEHVTKIFNEPFAQTWSEERMRRKITNRALTTDPDSYPVPQKFREVKKLPENMQIESSFVVYDDKVAVLSSPDELFAFVVESADFATTMKSLFEKVWQSIK